MLLHADGRQPLLVAVPGLVRLACEPVLDRNLGAGNAPLDEPSDDAPVLDAGRVVVAGEEEGPAVQCLLDRGFLLALRQGVVSGGLRLAVERHVVRVDHGVLEVVDDVAAHAGDSLARRDQDVHRALRVRPRRLADDSREDLDRPGELEVEQPHGTRRVQAVDVVLHVLGRVLRSHDPRGGELELAAVRDYRGVREAIVLAGVVDVVVRVHDPADVVALQAVQLELRVEALPLLDVPRHPEPPHDLRARRSRVHEDGVVAAEYQVAPRLRPDDAPELASEDEERTLDVDVHQVEHLDLVRRRHALVESVSHLGSSVNHGLETPFHYAEFVPFRTIDELDAALRGADYLPDRGLATALFLGLALEKPVLLEGEAGVGKTEAAKALATALSARLIRLQCYEGLDVSHAVYEWNYPRQLLHIRAAQEGTVSEEELFGSEFLIRRPLLEAIDSDEPVVLLIDEIDRADEEFEAFLLEVLSDFQITIPELGTIRARRKPAVILTSNRTRELHDALKRRTLFHWIGHPAIEREVEIVMLRVPGIPERLAKEAASFVRGLRGLDLAKPPGVAETIDWAQALAALGREEIDAEVVEQTLGSVLKYREDIETVRDETLVGLIEEARASASR